MVQAYLEVCDLPEMEAKLIKLKEKAMMHINDSHVSPSGLQHAPWNCFDVPNPLAHFMVSFFINVSFTFWSPKFCKLISIIK